MTTKKALIIRKANDQTGVVVAVGDEAPIQALKTKLGAFKQGASDTVDDALDGANLNLYVVALTTVVDPGADVHPDSDVYAPAG